MPFNLNLVYDNDLAVRTLGQPHHKKLEPKNPVYDKDVGRSDTEKPNHK